VVPWRDRPGIARACRKAVAGVASLGDSSLLWCLAGASVTSALVLGALHLGYQSGPVIVHLVWPV
jgi:hypothetical protein